MSLKSGKKKFELLDEISSFIMGKDITKTREWMKKKFKTRFFAELETDELEQALAMLQENDKQERLL